MGDENICDACRRRSTCIFDSNVVRSQCALYAKVMYDVVAVIRCKDCARRGCRSCGWDTNRQYAPPDDWFCADGEPKN